MIDALEPGWRAVFEPVLATDYSMALNEFLGRKRREGVELLPPEADWFNAFRLTPLESVRVVILGQDPYPTPGHAHGLCFSVRRDVSPLPRSLINIYRELADDLGIVNRHGDLSSWARQGVLLLNTVLTVDAGQAASHRGKGWEAFTRSAIEAVNAADSPVAFILWGNDARKRGEFLDRKRHLVLESAHPSPLSARRGFFGSRPFSRTNAFLESRGLAGIDWRV